MTQDNFESSRTAVGSASAGRGGGHGLACFGIFAVFLVYYVGAAAIQTPLLSHIAVIPVGGCPLGLLLSLGIFPLSWILIAIWFWKTR